MKYEVTGYHICVPLTDRQWTKLSRIDNSSRKDWYEKYIRFTEKLKAVGADRIEFNGHFGSNFFFQCDTLEEAEAVTTTLQKLLK